MVEIDGDAVTDDRLHLPQTPGRLVRMANPLSWFDRCRVILHR